MAVFMFSLAGMPPFAGFIGKFYLFAAVIDKEMWLLAVVAGLNSVIALYYYARILRAMYFENPVDGDPIMKADLPNSILVGVMVLGTVVFGVYWAPVVDFAERSILFFGSREFFTRDADHPCADGRRLCLIPVGGGSRGRDRDESRLLRALHRAAFDLRIHFDRAPVCGAGLGLIGQAVVAPSLYEDSCTAGEQRHRAGHRAVIQFQRASSGVLSLIVPVFAVVLAAARRICR
jgi:hypothetical protein